ncbi:c-type cytochrome biogenesis protein CcmI [Pseudorhodobacter turbinis]|uniref:C-type cytochrome biogenesis protein CcmI n=1 Tax=Pseudorhodobacter turbinis TaxID=2500533 RepID=A0A4P8EDE8_9RHOB|nr:c-type cytochrome biogenesis protein CcmI [Pseudorhodobacter turbinis]QCO54768.1 c-type cytochrome biogenesis protein CcmI [Pseudorhodobacter turbinis]
MADSIFWAAAGAIALVVAVILIRALRRPERTAADSSSFDQQVYRDQLAEIERDAARGVVAPDEAKRLRSEVARRLLAADRVEANRDVMRSGPASVPVVIVIALVLAAGFGGYAYLGQPGYGDLPLKTRIAMAEERRANRPDQAAMEAALPPRPLLDAIDPEFKVLVERLREAVAARPDDLQGQTLLARNEANLGNLTAAYKAQERVIALKGADATVGDMLTQATLMVQATDGQVSPEADRILQRVLAIEPKNDTALFFSGIANMQVGRYDVAFLYWKEVLENAAPDSPWRPEVRARIESLAQAAGARYSLPPEAPGPSAADIAAAEDLSPEDRQAMIRSMVEGLNDRLATDGGTAQEWARLIGALATLGEVDRARAIWAEAKVNFAGRTAELGFINEAALDAGITP